MNGKLRIVALSTVLALLLLPLAGTASADGPTVEISKSQAGTGGSVTVSGSGWRAHALLMMLVCGQSTPSRGVIGGTNSCANSDGRAVTTDAKGSFSKKLPVAEPPVPCPCVVHVATVEGAKAQADAVFQVAGHAVEPLPAEPSGGRLSVLTDPRLDGSSGLLTWFGAPASRTLVLTVGNAGTTAIRNPVFQLGTSHGVFAPQWEDQEWRGTIAPGKRAQLKLPVELTAGAHGDYTVSLKYDGKVLAEQPWGVGRPWGVTLFWLLVCVVVPAAVFRAGMAIVDRVRPRRAGGLRHRGLHLPELTLRIPKFTTRAAPEPPSNSTLPWFTPDSDPGTAGRLSAPHHDDSPTSPTTPTRKGPP
ncbi:hypothetical protein [Streptomyces guryensis]|uniref:Neocarzinostatin family protein n=1 Tax=Streptomyces guryensis TaxID=2886947 RepID=A0A9Q3VMX4_9ACTN|nr:hypothetical protein [Streptomyces guryensis]MCD9875484.1 hypothetical protein [Streptomyces guryensis]